MPTDIDPVNEEIKKALEEFEQTNPAAAAPAAPVPQKSTLVEKLTAWIAKHSGGLVSEEAGATYLLGGLAALAILISIFIIMAGRPDIPKGARENPEYGLPIRD